MHSIVNDLYDMCMFNIPINLKSLLNTIYNDKYINIYGDSFDDVEDLYDFIETNNYSCALELELYTDGLDEEATPYIYNYNYINLKVYDKSFDDWYDLDVFFSKEDIMTIGCYNDSYNALEKPTPVRIDDDIRIITIVYNNSFIAEINLFDSDNNKFIYKNSLIWPHLANTRSYYQQNVIKKAKLLKEYEQNETERNI